MLSLAGRVHLGEAALCFAPRGRCAFEARSQEKALADFWSVLFEAILVGRLRDATGWPGSRTFKMFRKFLTSPRTPGRGSMSLVPAQSPWLERFNEGQSHPRSRTGRLTGRVLSFHLAVNALFSTVVVAGGFT